MDPHFLDELIAVLGADNVLTLPEDLLCYAYDAASDLPSTPPDVVVTPWDSTQVAAVVKLAAASKIPLYTRGAGTNLSGGTIPLRQGIVLSMLNMDKILEIDAENLTARVQAGTVIQSLLDAAEPYGLLYPPDPGTVKTATMGGSAAECSGGLRGLKYGVTKDYILGMEIVTADGDIISLGGKTVKNVSGYNLPQLFVGSEGTLGIITELLVKLVPIPEASQAMLAVFMDLDKAADAIRAIIARKIIPATLEIMDNITIRTVEDFKKIGLPVDAEAILLVEVDGIRGAVDQEAARVKEVLAECGATAIRVAADAAERDQLWEARRSALPALVRSRPTTILEDATVPRSKIPEMIRAIRAIAAKHQIQIGTFGHAGDGNLHPTILTDIQDADEMRRVRLAIDEIFATALELGGTLSGEHGIGLAKAGYMESQFGKPGMDLMKKIKRALDPDNILNPGKIFVDL
jgi:glycolate oxidase